MSELKPCPFCGGDPKITHAVLKEYYNVDPDIACEKCGYHIKKKNLAINIDYSTKENCDFLDKQTIKAWNTRPGEDARDREIERLKIEVERLNKIINNVKQKCEEEAAFSGMWSSVAYEVILEIITEEEKKYYEARRGGR